MSSSRIGGIRAAVLAQLDQALHGQQLEGLAQRRTRDAQQRAQLELDQYALGRQLAADDQRTQPLGGALVQAGPVQPRAVGHGAADAQHFARPATLLLRLHHQLVCSHALTSITAHAAPRLPIKCTYSASIRSTSN